MPIAPNRLILFLVVHNINKANKVGMTKTLHEAISLSTFSSAVDMTI